MSHIGVDTFFDIDVVDNFAFAARITVIIIYFWGIRLYESTWA